MLVLGSPDSHARLIEQATALGAGAIFSGGAYAASAAVLLRDEVRTVATVGRDIFQNWIHSQAEPHGPTRQTARRPTSIVPGSEYTL
jgi:hypothetical protein